jgi:hypothetical protein
MSDEKRVTIELLFTPSVDLISVARRFVSDFYRETLEDPDAIARLCMATHELLENSAKYSTDGVALLRIEADRAGPERLVVVRTSNRTTRESCATVETIVREMNEAPHPATYYQALLRKNGRRAGGSGLGLARIRAEGEMGMSCDVVDDRLTITATMTATVRKP